jgi:hypothetical protein
MAKGKTNCCLVLLRKTLHPITLHV